MRLRLRSCSTNGMRRARCPGVAGIGDGVRVRLAVTVPKSRVGEQARHSAVEGIRRGPVEVGRGIEVARNEHRRAVGREAAERRERPGFCDAYGGFIGAAGQVDVGHRDDLARAHHHPGVQRAAVERGGRVGRCARLGAHAGTRIEDRPARDESPARIDVGHAGDLGNALEISVGLLHADDVRVGRADRLADLREAHLFAAVPDVERHHAQRHRLVRRDGRRERAGLPQAAARARHASSRAALTRACGSAA